MDVMLESFNIEVSPLIKQNRDTAMMTLEKNNILNEFVVVRSI